MEFIQSTIIYGTLVAMLSWVGTYLPMILVLFAAFAVLILITTPSNQE